MKVSVNYRKKISNSCSVMLQEDPLQYLPILYHRKPSLKKIKHEPRKIEKGNEKERRRSPWKRHRPRT